MVHPHVALDSLLHCFLCSYGSSSCCILLIVILFFWFLIVLPHVALKWLWYCVSVFSWFFLMLHWIDCDIVFLCSYGCPSCCIRLIAILFTCVFMVLPHVAFDWMWYRFMCFHGSSSCCFWFIVTLFIFVLMVLPHFCIVGLFICTLMVLPHVALDGLWHCLSVFSWFLLMLHWIDCDSIYLCSYGSSLCCIWLIVTLFNGSFPCCFGLIVTLFTSVLMVPPHVALDWLWHCLSVFLWVFLMLHWIDCDIFYLCSYRSSLCCIVLIVTLFICVLMVLPHVALDWMWHCLSGFSWFFLMLHWIDCDIFICVPIGLPYVALDWLWHFYLCSHDSSSCRIRLNVALFNCVLMVLTHVALDWLWQYLSLFLWVFLILHLIDFDIV